jgi:hypothetical protein
MLILCLGLFILLFIYYKFNDKSCTKNSNLNACGRVETNLYSSSEEKTLGARDNCNYIEYEKMKCDAVLKVDSKKFSSFLNNLTC